MTYLHIIYYFKNQNPQFFISDKSKHPISKTLDRKVQMLYYLFWGLIQMCYSDKKQIENSEATFFIFHFLSR